jgi:exoribonuclease II
MTHFYRNVPKLGHVAVSRHAQNRMEEDNISEEAFERALLTPVKPDIKDGADIVWRERDGIRIVILENPTPPSGAKLVKTVYRIEAQTKAK